MSEDADAYQQAVTKLMTYIDNTAAFAQEQLPDVARQMLEYGAYTSSLWMFIALVVVALTLLAMFFSAASGNEAWPMWFVSLGISLMFAGSNYSTIKKIELAPKLYIMDEMAAKIRRTRW